jgi:Resolvase, N terminal domain
MTARAPSRAAQCLRTPTEHQQYSPENQLEIIRQYAAAHDKEIVQDYSDLGHDGLNIAGRLFGICEFGPLSLRQTPPFLQAE